MDFPSTPVKGGIVSRKLRAVARMCDHLNRYLTEERYGPEVPAITPAGGGRRKEVFPHWKTGAGGSGPRVPPGKAPRKKCIPERLGR